jgi:hypothetical protein
MAVTLSEIIRTYKQQTNSHPNYYHLESNNKLLQNLNLLVRQKRLGLNIEPFLKNNPELAKYLLQLEKAIPELFNSRKKVYLNRAITAKLSLSKHQHYWIETSLDLAIARTRYLLLAWSLNEFQLSLKDRANLWATCKFLKIDPTTLNLVHYFLSTNKAPIRTIYRWDSKQQKETQKLLKNIGFQVFYQNFNKKKERENSHLNKIENANVIKTIEEIEI